MRTHLTVVAIVTIIIAMSSAADAAPAGSLDGESFTSTVVTSPYATCFNGEGHTATFTFTASGTASGPYPGTFTETGTFSIGPFGATTSFPPLATFEADFTITSGATTIVGHKSLPSPVPSEGMNSANCSNGGPTGLEIDAYTVHIGAYLLTYTATINEPRRSLSASGVSKLDTTAVSDSTTGSSSGSLTQDFKCQVTGKKRCR